MYAQIIDGIVKNPVPASAQADVGRFFHPDFIVASGGLVTWVFVPDGTRHGATDNGDGTYTNPEEPPKRAAIYSKTAFQDHAVAQLAVVNQSTVAESMARFTTIMEATKASDNGAVRFAYARYEAALTFEKENTSTLTALMAADDTEGHLTTDERAAILDNWPEA